MEELKAIIATAEACRQAISQRLKKRPNQSTLLSLNRQDRRRRGARRSGERLRLSASACLRDKCSGGFDPKIAEIANGFTGARVTIIAARACIASIHRRAHQYSCTSEWFGSIAARRRRGVCFGACAQMPASCALCRCCDTGTPKRNSRCGGPRSGGGAQRSANVAKHYQVEMENRVRTGIAPEVAILRRREPRIHVDRDGGEPALRRGPVIRSGRRRCSGGAGSLSDLVSGE